MNEPENEITLKQNVVRLAYEHAQSKPKCPVCGKDMWKAETNIVSWHCDSWTCYGYLPDSLWQEMLICYIKWVQQIQETERLIQSKNPTPLL